MAAFHFDITTDKATENKIRAKKIQNIWAVAGKTKDGYLRIGSWYPTKEQARAHIQRAIKNVVFKHPKETEMASVKLTPGDQGFDEVMKNNGNDKKKLFIAGGTIAGLAALGFIFRKKIAKLLHR